ncbi:hypothetical protein M2164_000670 [Streptomyces sp. SAI-208]|jgi:hypothetical protein|nr:MULTISPECIES: hypothetical protein [unclassified Streptomyces]MDH6514194.1 hypothetical protein [Streptomyces sp. SAI-090]MDH6546373.1 hypothetical protein [Streptomyces sp. SAI-041]MDH6565472.1 hypothetical protein [Streptomyces sp. SAI-117]MDH6589611.1 hypothetical protein [Streptomyces sp. SAI-133]MDH6605035.1 hypothetical protein [Streptomyces sp. SAI-208]
MEMAQAQALKTVAWLSAHRFPVLVLLALAALVVTGVGASMCCLVL